MRYNKYRRELDEYVSHICRRNRSTPETFEALLMRDALVEPSDRNRNKFNL